MTPVSSCDTLIPLDSDPNLSPTWINGFESGRGTPRFGGSRSGRATVDEVATGTLVLDMMELTRRSIIWRGIAAKELDAKAKPEKKDQNTSKTAEKIFTNYPPEAQGGRLSEPNLSL